MKLMHCLKLTGISLVVAMAAACGAATEPQQQMATGPKLPPTGPDGEYTVKFPEQSPGADRFIRLTLGEEISKDCGLVKVNFEFNSTEPLPQEKLELQSLSECLAAPERKDLKLTLIGRADNRGDGAYNQQLGLKRATHVKNLLVSAGIAADRIAVESRGENEAVGNDGMYSYGYDRRVDVVLRGLVHAPR